MENVLFNANIDKEKNILTIIWLAETQDAIWNDIKAAMLYYISIVEKYRPKGILIDERELYHPWTPDYQSWVDEEIGSKLLKAGIKYFAIVTSKDFFVEVSVKQLMEEKNTSQLITNFFEDPAIAQNWIEISLQSDN